MSAAMSASGERRKLFSSSLLRMSTPLPVSTAPSTSSFLTPTSVAPVGKVALSSISAADKNEADRPNSVVKTTSSQQQNAHSLTVDAEPMKELPEEEWYSTVATLEANKEQIISLTNKGAQAATRKSEIERLELQILALTSDHKRLKASVHKFTADQVLYNARRSKIVESCETSKANFYRVMEELEGIVVDQQDLFSDD